MWQGQPIKKVAEFFSITRVYKWKLLPKFTDVLSTDIPAQLTHGILISCNMLSVSFNITEAVADSFPKKNNNLEMPKDLSSSNTVYIAM